MKGQTRYAVRLETWSLTSLPMGAVTGAPKPQPHVEYRYYRWRWFAKLCAFMDSGVSIAGHTRATLLGRVRMKSEARIIEEQSFKFQLEMYERNRWTYEKLPNWRELQEAADRSARIEAAWIERLTQTSVN